jgi:type IV secretory pathway TraG/TraD family ATPase VirD4
VSRATANLLKWLCLLASIGLFFLSLAEVKNTSVVVARAMQRVGWSRYIGRAHDPLLPWMVGCMWRAPCQRAFFYGFRKVYPIWIPIAGIASLYAAGIFRIVADRARERQKVLPGAARWARERELRHLIRGEKGSPLRGYLGILAPEKKPRFWADPQVLRIPERLRCSHCLVVGGPGARKTTGYHKPNVLADALDGVSVVLFDLKYPDPESGFLDLVPFFVPRGYDVQMFLPFDQTTLVLPLLSDVRTLEDAYDLTDMVLPVPQREHPSNFYRNLERQLFVSLVLGVANDHRRSPDDPYHGPPSFRRILRLCLSGIREIERYVHTHPDARVRSACAGLFDVEERLLGGIAAGVAGMLQLFDDDRLERATAPVSDPRLVVDLQGIGERPTLLYIGIPQERVQGGRGQLLLQLIKRAVDRALLQTADRHGGKCPQHVSVYMDEFRAMGYLPNVSEVMATMRSRRVCYHLSLQNRAQGEELYGVAGFRSFFVNNVQTVIIFPRYLKFEDAQYFSDALGYMTVEQLSTGFTRRTFEVMSGSRTEWMRDVLRPLLPPEEYPDWPDAAGILFTTGVRPVKVLFPRMDEDTVMGMRNPLVWFGEEVDPVRELLASEWGRRRVVEAMMEHHFRWVERFRPDVVRAAGEVKPPEAVAGPPALAAVEGAAAPREVVGRPPQSQAVQEVREAEPPSRPGGRVDARPVSQERDGAGDPQLAASLREWVGKVASLDLPPGSVRAYMHNRRLTKLGIVRAAIPAELSVPPRLMGWMSARWVRVTPSEIALLPRAFGVVRREHLAALRRASRQHPGSGRPSAPVVAPPSARPSPGEDDVEAMAVRALEAVREWVRTHGENLEGHPQRREDVELLGVYTEGESVALLPEVVTRVLQEAGIPDHRQREVRERWRDAGWIRPAPGHLTALKRVGGRIRRVYEFSWSVVVRRASA